MAVTRIRTAVALGALLLWTVAPALACFLPGEVTSAAERECCQKMATHCGHSMTPTTHGCCRVPSRPETMMTQANVSPPAKYAIAVVAAELHPALTGLNGSQQTSFVLSESPPGGLSLCSSAILRI